MPKSKTKKLVAQSVVNRRARFDYELGEEIVAGLVLTGMEVRAAREGHVQLKGAFVSLRNGELWLNNAQYLRRQRLILSARILLHPSKYVCLNERVSKC